MSQRDVLRALSAGRAALGAGMVAAPVLAGRPWIGPDASSAGAKVIGRAFGVRDVVLGLGTIEADRRGEGLRTWIAAGVIADAVDLVATLAAGDEIPARGRRAVAVLASGAALTGLVLLRGAEA